MPACPARNDYRIFGFWQARYNSLPLPIRRLFMADHRLPPNQQVLRGDRWPVVGEKGPCNDDAPWTIKLSGSVIQPRTFTLDELQALPQVTQVVDVHCVTRWSKLEMQFTGVALSTVIGTAASPQWSDSARYVSFLARSNRNHSTSLSLRELLEVAPLIAFQAEGQPLATEHGGPVRMVVPGKYFYKSVKWLAGIEFLVDDRLGYWESEAGYHNGANPWQEERFIGCSLSKREAAKLIMSRDFAHRELLGISAASRKLDELKAHSALLRNADFRGSQLNQADFRHAKLCNAQFQEASLQHASFENADLEGANFSSADLSGANLSKTSLFGTTFCEFDANGQPVAGARFSHETRFSLESLDALTPDQRAFVLRWCPAELLISR